jgi:hypothetical protein
MTIKLIRISRWRRRAAIGVILTLLAALSWSAEALYDSPGELLPFSIDDSVSLSTPDAERQLPLRIVYPERGGPFPVIILSHGTFSSGKKYDRVATHWAEVRRTRVADMSRVLDALDEIEARIPALQGRMNRQSLIAAGHSFGTQVAMLVTGLRIKNPTNDVITEADEHRFNLLILLSDPGKMALMPEQMWQGSTVPTFMVTGDEDYGLMGDGRRSADYQNEILSDAGARDAVEYLLMIDKGDHYFGGLIHKDVDDEPDHEGLEIFNAASTAFLDAHAKGSDSARDYLQAGTLLADTDGRARLTVE